MSVQAITSAQEEEPVGACMRQPTIEHPSPLHPVVHLSVAGHRSRPQHQRAAGGIGLSRQGIQGDPKGKLVTFFTEDNWDDARLLRPLFDPLRQKAQLPLRQGTAPQPLRVQLGKAEAVSAHLLLKVIHLLGESAAQVKLFPRSLSNAKGFQRAIAHPTGSWRWLTSTRCQHL
ncbi:hypothetical protein D3C76_1373620 [compost metagenome]